MIDAIPPYFWVPAAIILWSALIVLTVADSRNFHRREQNRDASDPVVVTGSGHRSNRGVRSCGGVR